MQDTAMFEDFSMNELDSMMTHHHTEMNDAILYFGTEHPLSRNGVFGDDEELFGGRSVAKTFAAAQAGRILAQRMGKGAMPRWNPRRPRS